MDDDLDFGKSPEGSNGSSLESIIKEEFGGEVAVSETEGEISLEVPDDYTEEQKAKLQRRVEDFKLDHNKLKENNMNVKRKEQELEAELQKAKELREQYEAKLNAPQTPAPSDNIYKKYWGVESAEDVEDLRTENPDLYWQGQQRFNEGTAAAHSVRSAQAEMLKATIRSEGHNPLDVEAFARAHSMSDMGAAYDYFKLKTGKATGRGTSLPDYQKKQVTIVPRGIGGGRSQEDKSKQAAAEYNAIPKY